MKNLFPLVGVCIHKKKSFIIHSIDFENETVFNRTAQNGDGNSYGFSDIYIMEHEDESIVDFLMNTDVNYNNHDLIDGEKTIYDNKYHEEPSEKRRGELRLVEEKKREKELYNNQIRQKIEELKKRIID